MTLKEAMALVNAGYTKSEIQAMEADQQTPPAAPAAQTPAAAAPVVPMIDPRQIAAAAVPRQPMTPSDVPPVTLSDVLGAVNQLALKISTPAPAPVPVPAFGEPQPRGLDDIVTGFLGVAAPNAPKQ